MSCAKFTFTFKFLYYIQIQTRISILPPLTMSCAMRQSPGINKFTFKFKFLYYIQIQTRISILPPQTMSCALRKSLGITKFTYKFKFLYYIQICILEPCSDSLFLNWLQRWCLVLCAVRQKKGFYTEHLYSNSIFQLTSETVSCARRRANGSVLICIYFYK